MLNTIHEPLDTPVKDTPASGGCPVDRSHRGSRGAEVSLMLDASAVNEGPTLQALSPKARFASVGAHPTVPSAHADRFARCLPARNGPTSCWTDAMHSENALSSDPKRPPVRSSTARSFAASH
jgi:hypothetical protein